MLYELLPLVIQLRDQEEGGGLLKLLFDLLEEEYEVEEDEIRGFLRLVDPELVRIDLLPLLAAFLGGKIPDSLDEKAQRRYVGNLVYMYRFKGTVLSWKYWLGLLGMESKVFELWKSILHERDNYSRERDSEHPYRSARVCFEPELGGSLYGGLCDWGYSRELIKELEWTRPIHVLVPLKVKKKLFEEPRLGISDRVMGDMGMGFLELEMDYVDDLGAEFKCVTTCQSTCQERCEIACLFECQTYCEGVGCEYPCEGVNCQLSCQYFCTESCQGAGCLEDCQSTCQTVCRENKSEAPCLKTCQGVCTTCQTSSQVCVTYCQIYCQLEDQFLCNTACQVHCQQEAQVVGCVEPTVKVLYFGLSSTEPSLDGKGYTEPEIGSYSPLDCETSCQTLEQIGSCRTYREHPDGVLCYYDCQVACESSCEASCQYSDTTYCWTKVEGKYEPTSYRRCAVDGRSIKRVRGSDLGYTEPDLKDVDFFVNDVEIVYSDQVEGWGQFPYFTVFDSASGGNLIAYGKLDEVMDTKVQYPVVKAGKAVFRLLSSYRTARKLGDVVFPQVPIKVKFLPIEWRLLGEGGMKEEGVTELVPYRSFLENLCKGNVDRLRMALLLVKDGYVFDPEHSIRGDVIDQEVSGEGYVGLGRYVDTSVRWNENVLVLGGDRTLWHDTTVVSQVGGAVFYCGVYLMAYLPMRKLLGVERGSVEIVSEGGIFEMEV